MTHVKGETKVLLSVYMIICREKLLPRQTLKQSEDHELISNWLDSHSQFIAKDLEIYLNKSKGAVRIIFDELLYAKKLYELVMVRVQNI